MSYELIKDNFTNLSQNNYFEPIINRQNGFSSNDLTYIHNEPLIVRQNAFYNEEQDIVMRSCYKHSSIYQEPLIVRQNAFCYYN